MKKELILSDEKKIPYRPKWDEYFMAMAYVASSRSGCNHVKAGSVIVNSVNRIIGTGYNGAAPGYPNHLEIGCRKEAAGRTYADSMNSGLCEGIHAEMNALANLTIATSKGFTLYTTIFPCHTCAKNLAAYQPKRIVFSRKYDEKEFERTKDYFERGKIEIDEIEMTFDKLIRIILSHSVSTFDVFSDEERRSLEEVLV